MKTEQSRQLQPWWVQAALLSAGATIVNCIILASARYPGEHWPMAAVTIVITVFATSFCTEIIILFTSHRLRSYRNAVFTKHNLDWEKNRRRRATPPKSNHGNNWNLGPRVRRRYLGCRPLHLPMDSADQRPAAHNRHRSLRRIDCPDFRRLNGHRTDNRRLQHGRTGRPTRRSGKTGPAHHPRASTRSPNPQAPPADNPCPASSSNRPGAA